MTTRSEGEQAPHPDAPAARDTDYWVHNDGTRCADWARCDTYEHHRPDGTETITKIKAKTKRCSCSPGIYCRECRPDLFVPTVNEQSPFDEAMSLVEEVIDGRVDVYGDPAKVFVRHAQIWSGILGIEVQPWQVALCMMGYKLGRTAITPDYSDNSDDIEGYLDIFRTLLGEDMIVARDTAAYIAGGGKGVRT